MKASSSMLDSWEHKRKMGLPLEPLFALVSLGVIQPKDYIIGWSKNEDTLCFLARKNQLDLTQFVIVEFKP